ncbi:hypothetical protein MJO28_006183, partial [Puccinia striiformis f. sp. tritici]
APSEFPPPKPQQTLWVQTTANISAPAFYNCPYKTQALLGLSEGPPRFNVLLGPSSSGKTRLVEHVTSMSRADGTPKFSPLTIDLREDELSVLVFTKDWLNIFKGAGWAADSRYLNLNTIKSSGVPPVRISNELIRRLKLWSSLHGERPPILIIDEAHSFKRATDKCLLEGKQRASIDNVAAKDHRTCSLIL